ncbi:MAG: MASE1 domain-containing protein, partial [Phycisphaeraceae bacterium JB051]
MEQLPGSLKPSWRVVIGAFAYAFAYVISVTWSLNPPYTTIWLCSGVSLYILLRLPVKWWSAQLLATAAVWLVMSMSFNQLPLKFAVIGIVANTLDPWFCALIIRRYAGRRIDISQIRHITVLLVAIWISTMLTALIGAYAVRLAQGGGAYWHPMFRWALSGGLGTMLVVWSMFAWTTPECRDKRTTGQIIERVIVLGGIFGLTWVMFRYPLLEFTFAIPQMHLRTLPMIWVLIRFGPRSVSLMLCVSIALIVVNAVMGYGPYADSQMNVVHREIALVSQQLISVASCILICSVITDRSR